MSTLTLEFKGKILQAFPLEDGLLSIGREPGCDIHIDSLAVERQHARIIIRNDQSTISQSSPDNPTFVNHKPIDETILKHNDLIRIGKHTLRYRDEPLPVAVNNEKTEFPTKSAETIVQTSTVINDTPVPAAGWLQVMSGRNLGKIFKLRAGLTDLGTLGMTPTLIALRQSGYFISSLTRNNQLSVADQDIGEKSHPLNDGDLIKIGRLTLQFHLHA